MEMEDGVDQERRLLFQGQKGGRPRLPPMSAQVAPGRSLVEALPVRALSRVPDWFRLPPIEGNVAEGLVLKPDAGASLRSEIVLDVLVDLEAAFPGAFAALGADDEERLRGNVETLAARNTTRLICLASAKARG